MSEGIIEVVGIGEDGWEGLSPAARRIVEAADLLVGGDRHLELVPDMGKERLAWPKPLTQAFDTLDARSRAGTVVVLATGNPLWYGVANMLVRRFGAERVRVRPHASAFDLACARLGWSEADVDTLTLHGRPPSLIQPFIQPGARLLVLSEGHETPGQLAEILSRRGFGPSQLAVLEHLGGQAERIVAGTAESWDPARLADLNVVAVHCRPGAQAQVLSTSPGLPDDAFQHDGQLTKQEVRAATLAALQPGPEQHLWDVGAGSGSVGIEWMRAARGATAVAVEPQQKRLAMIADNALALGTPGLEIVAGRAPDDFGGLDAPDAVFVGGGVHSGDILPACWQALKAGGRLVANAVTLEGEAALLAWHAEHGGELTRLQVSRADPIGPYHGWRPLMAVTQLKAAKPWGRGERFLSTTQFIPSPPSGGGGSVGGGIQTRKTNLGDEEHMTGRLVGLGIGPGDPDLITLKAYRLLREADVVAYPAPEEGESLARKLVAPHLPGGQTEMPIRMPITVARFPAQEIYDQAAGALSEHLEAGRTVAVLCEGDPFFYGSFMYLFGRMAERHPVEVVPGVSSLTACSAVLGAPLAARNDVLSVIPAPLEAEELKRQLASTDAAAVIKLGRHFAKVRGVLDELGLTPHARYVERATMDAQRILPLEEVDESAVPYFSMILLHARGEAWRV